MNNLMTLSNDAEKEYFVNLYNSEVNENTKTIWIVMEYCQNGTLEDYVKQKKGLDNKLAMNFFYKLVGFFAFFRKFKLVHRDIKPANILITRNSLKQFILKISDFGFSVEENANLFEDSIISVGFSAPEMTNNEK